MVSSFLDVSAGDDGPRTEEEDDDDDTPLSKLLVTAQEAEEQRRDKEFINDNPSLSLSPRNGANSSDEQPETVERRRSGRLRRLSSAVDPPQVASRLDFSDASGDDPSYEQEKELVEMLQSNSKSDANAQPEPKKKKKKKKRRSRAHQTLTSKSRSKSKKRSRMPALWRLVGKELLSFALEHGHTWEEQLYGFYDSWSDGDLPVADFHRAHEWFTRHFVFHSLGRERGEDMGKLHTQGHGASYGPPTKAGCNALAQKYKEDMNIVTHSRRKVQFKCMDAGQPEDKMCAYTRKWRSFHEFLFVSSDRNGDAYTDEYLDHCDDKYRVPRASTITTVSTNFIRAE